MNSLERQYQNEIDSLKAERARLRIDLTGAAAHLRVALAQVSDTDDHIIVLHVSDALKLLRESLAYMGE